ncbi:MAG TPA: polysaccharide deacetylase family protein [Sphingobacterium sp.]|jgi:peptidoglycan/xylan/chitin deacetylase (PgdA/CDA1 family)|nr:polysaccharide deacetylase family protein [Sphingobacterium sp.]
MLKHAVLFPFFLVIGVLALLHAIWQGSFGWLAFVCCAGVGITAWGAFDIRLGYFTETFYRKKHLSSKLVALTFDDGPTAHTAQILELLQQHGAKATFFCVGKQLLVYPEVLKDIVHQGHTVGNHTFSHSRSFGFLNETQVKEEIGRTDEVIRNLLGRSPKFFRPPFGVTNPSVAKAVKYTKHQVIGWSNRSLDTITFDEGKIFERVCRKLTPGDIILFHDTSPRTVNVLRRLLPYLQKEGYTCVSVDDLLNLYPYDT